MDLLVIAKMETVFKVFDHEQDAINSFFPERQVPRFDILEFLRQKSVRNKSVHTPERPSGAWVGVPHSPARIFLTSIDSESLLKGCNGPR